MTRQKDLKRVVRTRMRKTGESYTAARVHVLARRGAGAKRPAEAADGAAAGALGTTAKAPSTPSPSPETTERPKVTARRETAGRSKVAAKPGAAAKRRASAKAAAPAPDYAALAGFSDETIAAKTGCTWEKWVGHLDHIGAAGKPHGEIAAHVHEKFGVPGWWAQAVTVGYERIRGLREIGQRRSGAYEVNKSKTIAAPVERVFAAFTEPALRRRWLPGVELTVRKATPGRSVRITWEDDTSVEVWLQSKGDGRSVAGVQHRKLPDRARADAFKEYWAGRLDALARMLAASPA